MKLKKTQQKYEEDISSFIGNSVILIIFTLLFLFSLNDLLTTQFNIFNVLGLAFLLWGTGLCVFIIFNQIKYNFIILRKINRLDEIDLEQQQKQTKIIIKEIK